MNKLLLSVAMKGSYTSYAIYYEGRCLKHTTIELGKECNYIEKLMHGIIQGLRVVKNLVNEDMNKYDSLIIESSNSVVLKWINDYMSNGYEELFSTLLDELNSIPLMFHCVFINTPKARVYTSNKYVKKEKMYGIMDLEVGEK